MGGVFKVVVIGIIFKLLWDFALVINTGSNEVIAIDDHHIY
jgi:hypothetical protein